MKDIQLVGVDIGGTKITAGRVENGEIVKVSGIPTEAYKRKEEILENLIFAISEVITMETKAVGIGIPGIVDKINGIVCELNNIPSWKNFSLKKLLKKKINKEIIIDNDANCFVLGNKYFGIAKPYRNIVGITLGTGVGAGIFLEGKLYSGEKNGAGEIGQIPYAGANFETFCSGNFFSSIKNTTGEELYTRAKNGDQKAIGIWKEFGYHVAELVKTVIFAYAPESIVFGGSVSRGFEFFAPEIFNRLSQMKLRKVAEQLKIYNDTNQQAPVLGAAALFLDKIST